MDLSSLILIVGVLIIALVAVLGGVLALLKQKVVVDESGHVTEIEIPLIGRFRSNYPSIVAVAIGAVLAYSPLYVNGIKPDLVPITAKVLVRHPNAQMKPTVIVGAIPKNSRAEEAQVAPSQWKDIKVYVEKTKSYGVIVYTPTFIDPTTGSTTLAAVYGTPDENNVIEAELELFGGQRE
ncbi:hypothetical protein [Methyloceanibacter sp.]|uniref:hypothetical protein n=1 Tax=Methyloceanibacter sp. TaxID=1965321 RepID=UPI00208BF11E|nr:hypothetical protein [Methyloceanibacter sp.]GFO81577.1 MAG: hypothetical protein A49_12040 [Methyloceanibacter sp.]HML93735.1 hypothetical protein [Methyloceanibacter sp.]